MPKGEGIVIKGNLLKAQQLSISKIILDLAFFMIKEKIILMDDHYFIKDKNSSTYENASIMDSSSQPHTILGIDPGLHSTGYGFISSSNIPLKIFDWGCICPPTNVLISERLRIINDCLQTLIEQYPTCAISIETQFVFKNVNTALKLGMVRGIVLLLASQKGIPVFEYTPTKIKKACTGKGRASKSQMKYMIGTHLGLDPKHLQEDAADALAIASCHRQLSPYINLSKTTSEV
jgi:crossover junction endodeoxyribonuclease RuvC